MNFFDDDDDFLNAIDLDGLVASSTENDKNLPGSNKSISSLKNESTVDNVVNLNSTKNNVTSSSTRKVKPDVITSIHDDDDDDLLSTVDFDGLIASSSKTAKAPSSITTSGATASTARYTGKTVSSVSSQNSTTVVTLKACSGNDGKNQCEGTVVKQKTGIDKYFSSCGAKKTGVSVADSTGDRNNNNLSSKDTPDYISDVPEEFPFPFQPYDIQVGFMRALYQALDGGKIGIFESPTGTGKSLSLICGALTWLRDFEEKQRKEVEDLLKEQEEKNKAKKEEPDWITAFTTNKKLDDETKTIKERHEKMLKREARLKDLRKSRPANKYKKKKNDLDEKFDELFKNAPDEIRNAEDDFDAQNPNEETDDHLVVAEYHSDEEKAADSADEAADAEEEEDQCLKIFFCSRTHSQLAQFVREVKKSPFGSDARVVTLGSRQNLCVNTAVKKLNALSLINDRCLEMQKNKAEKKVEDGGKRKRKKLGGRCPYYKQENLYDFRDKVLAEVNDIEQLVTAGKQTKACPYYGTRYAIPDAQLVVLPYNTLLHKPTREACGIKLKDNIVIVDEAHNLVETINNVYSTEVTATQMTCAHSQLNQYMERYRSRLKAKNLMYIKQILFILTNMIKALGGKTGLSADKQKIEKTEEKVKTINSFLFDTGLDNLNLFKIMTYCGKSQISKKLHGFVEKYQPSVNIQPKPVQKDVKTKTGLTSFLKQISEPKDTKGNTQNDENAAGKGVETTEDREGITLSSPLMHIEGFLEALTNADKDGRIVIHKQSLLSQSSLKFLLLNPVVHFKSIVEEARAVIVAGGTMQPVSEFKEQLFFAAGANPERILEYSCGHVIPANHLLPIALAKGSTGLELDFTYQSRDSAKTLDELGRTLCNLCNLIPGGVVVFFPSYDYERRVYSHWEQNGMLGRLKAKKQVFREPKKAVLVEAILKEYSSVIEKCKSGCQSGQLTGGLLLSVVGGKMSEGINFSDDLGRCVVMVGLPYPNIKSPELKEKMDYLNANMPKSSDGRLPGQVLYENLCMKAVNQSIGRAIRHREDYACILLLDQRYHRGNVTNKLPEWISKHLRKMDTFGPTVSAIRKFFAEKKCCQEPIS